MKVRIFIHVFICLVFMLSLLQSVGALTYDFEDDAQADDWEALRGTWEIKDGLFYETAAADGPLVAAVGDPEWTNYTITVKAQGLVADADWGICFRIQDINNFYSWQYANSALMFVYYIGGARTELNLQGQGEVLNEWQDFEVVVEDNTFDLYWNGDLISTQENDAIDSGRIGLFSWVNGGSPVAGPGGGSAYDDLNAEGEGLPTSLAVSPDGRLSTTWGRIRGKHN